MNNTNILTESYQQSYKQDKQMIYRQLTKI